MVVVVWTALGAVWDGPGMVVAVLYDVVHVLTLLLVIGDILRIRSESATRSWLLMILPLLHRVQPRADDTRWWWSSPFAMLLCTLLTSPMIQTLKRVFEKCLPGELSCSAILEDDLLTLSYL